LSVNVGSVPAGDEFIVVGFIASVKVAVTGVPVTPPEPLTPIATFVALLPGLAEPTVLVAEAPGKTAAGA
jgi:hypothetical protein